MFTKSKSYILSSNVDVINTLCEFFGDIMMNQLKYNDYLLLNT